MKRIAAQRSARLGNEICGALDLPQANGCAAGSFAYHVCGERFSALPGQSAKPMLDREDRDARSPGLLPGLSFAHQSREAGF